jgi:molybdopterin-containing oxidoreductase family iron-sulfur binding subunit
MKTIPPACPEPETGHRYWRSLDQLADTPEFREFVEREFPAGASEWNDPVSRRHFVKLMSASFLLAGWGLTGCRRPVETVLPFSKMPENYLHGAAQHFATAMPVRGSAIPLVVKAHEGRPVKIEGNAEHPINAPLPGGPGHKHGGTDLLAQASILNLYDPDRAQRFTFKGENTTSEKAVDFLGQTAKRFAATQGKGLCFLVGRSSSPTRARLQKLLGQKLPQARWFVHEPVDFDIQRQAATLAFGKPVRPLYQLDRARRILSLDCDFVGGEEDSFRLIRGFAKGRRLEKAADDMSRLYVVEPLYSVTGTNADHRLRLPSSAVFPFTCRLFAEFLEQSKAQERDSRAGDFRQALLNAAEGLKVDAKWVAECVKDLLSAPGECLVLAGHRQPLEVHLLAQAINFYLGAIGSTMLLHEAPDPGLAGVADLARALNAGEVDTLVVLGGNPVYDAPADLAWDKTQRKAATVVRLGDHEDETFPVSDWHLPKAHYLESWGDARTGDGTLAPVQPLIQPLFGGLTEIEVLARLADVPEPSPHRLVRDTFRELASDGASEESWKRFLHDGFLAGSAAKPVEGAQYAWEATAPVILGAQRSAGPSADKLEVLFHRDYRMDDGRYNNNGWLQELPDPITKLTWDNVILLSEATAKAAGVQVHDMENNLLRAPIVRVEVGGRAVEGPAWIQPGLADHVVALALGYGRSRAGRVGRGTGYNAYAARASTAPHHAAGARLTVTGRFYPLSCTQNHGSMEHRPIVREATMAGYRKRPGFAAGMELEEPPVVQPLYPNPLDLPNAKGVTPKQDATHWWGMSIDLNTCVGCSACMIACQSENNIPIVGKDQVNRHREMHWIRIDRYYAGPVADPQTVHQPMMCQHCEAAPCESVCPVNATVHDNEGLNLMVYNRCVGTRYCSNNCPYKVRRFNFFDYNRRPLEQLKGPVYSTPLVGTTEGEWTLKRWWRDPDRGLRPQDDWDLLKLAKNPEVTVRMRGVMEKCTYCVQRLEQAKIAQKIKAGASGNVEVPDGTVLTACQQACPADAIVFGNVKDPASRVSQAKALERTYKVMDFLATKPRTTYLARVRNPNPAMPDYNEQPASAQEFASGGFAPLHGAGHGAAHSAPAAHGVESGQKGAH